MRSKPLAVILAAVVVGLLGGLPATASAAAPKGDVLFVQSAEGGSYEDGRLTLQGVSRQLAWFTDRPERDSGSTSFGDFRKALFSGKQAAPNAALDVAGKGIGGVTALVLRRPRFDPASEVVTYKVKRLKEVAGDLDHYVGRSKGKLPSSFGPASLFIDDALGNTCYTTVVDATGYPIETVSSSKWSTDDWAPALPSSFGLGTGHSWSWGSQGGAFRGCSNSAVWQLYGGASGTFSFQTTDPWSGGNTLTCSSSNPNFTCYQASVSGGTVTWSLSPTPP